MFMKFMKNYYLIYFGFLSKLLYKHDCCSVSKSPLGYEPAALTVQPPPQKKGSRVGSFLHGCLVPPKFFPKKRYFFVGDIKSLSL